MGIESRIIRFAGLWLALLFLVLTAKAASPDGHASRVREILADKCLSCHSPDPKKGGLA